MTFLPTRFEIQGIETQGCEAKSKSFLLKKMSCFQLESYYCTFLSASLQLLWRTPATYTVVIIWRSKANDRLLRATTLQSVPGFTCDSCKVLINKKIKPGAASMCSHENLQKCHPQEGTGRNRHFLCNYLSTSLCFMSVFRFKSLHSISCIWSNSCWKTVPHCLARFLKGLFSSSPEESMLDTGKMLTCISG